MEQEILEKIRGQEELLQKIFVSAEKTRKYFMWTLIISVTLVVVPLFGLMFVIPSFLSTISQAYSI